MQILSQKFLLIMIFSTHHDFYHEFLQRRYATSAAYSGMLDLIQFVGHKNF
jgi:hypothetical protein